MTDDTIKIEVEGGDPSPVQDIEERIRIIGDKIMSKALEFIDRNNSRGVKGVKKVSASEVAAHEENIRQFKILQSTYMQLQKMKLIKKPSSKSSEESTEDILARVKEKPSTMKGIVRDIRNGTEG